MLSRLPLLISFNNDASKPHSMFLNFAHCTKMWQTFQPTSTSHLCRSKQVLRETSLQTRTRSPRTPFPLAAVQGVTATSYFIRRTPR
jgi:hypothetical protein